MKRRLAKVFIRVTLHVDMWINVPQCHVAKKLSSASLLNAGPGYSGEHSEKGLQECNVGLA